jgi:hypothetical protein
VSHIAKGQTVLTLMRRKLSDASLYSEPARFHVTVLPGFVLQAVTSRTCKGPGRQQAAGGLPP